MFVSTPQIHTYHEPRLPLQFLSYLEMLSQALGPAMSLPVPASCLFTTSRASSSWPLTDCRAPFGKPGGLFNVHAKFGRKHPVSNQAEQWSSHSAFRHYDGHVRSTSGSIPPKPKSSNGIPKDSACCCMSDITR